MTKAKSSWAKTPNARLVYKTLKPEKGIDELLANSVNALVQLEQVVMEETRFQWANSHVFIYFFENPQALEFEKTPIWLAREVIGPPNEDAFERFRLHDLSSGTCLQRSVGPGVFELDMAKLKEKHLSLSSIFSAESQNTMAKTWRLKLDREGMSSQAQIQLFPE